MSEKKRIAVLGATGAQGGALARSILNDPASEFSVRALTRDPNSEKAKALAAMGAEVLSVDVDDPASLTRAFAGCYGAFCVTFFWEHLSPEKELAQARAMAEAARMNGLEHVIWSTLENTRDWVKLDDPSMPTLMGKYKVPHFDAKGEADSVFTSLGVPTTCLRTSFYWDNFIHFGMQPKPGEDGVLTLAIPMGEKRLPGMAAEDIGKCAYGILKRGSEFVGKTIGIAGEFPTGAEMAAAFAKALGREVRYFAVPFDMYRGFGFPGADDLGNMFQFKHDYNDVFLGNRDLALSRELNPELQTFATWLAANKSRIPVE